MATDHKINFEEDAQRQHVRIRIPARAKIDRASYDIVDISAGGFRIKSENEINILQSPRRVRVVFQFDDFAIQLNFIARPVFYDAEREVAGYRFMDAEGGRASWLKHIIESHLSGDLIAEGDLINIVPKDDFISTRKADNDNKAKPGRKTILPVMLFLLLGLAGLSYMSGRFLEPVSAPTYYTGLVEGTLHTVQANQDGVFNSLLDTGSKAVTKDQPLAVITAGASQTKFSSEALGNYVATPGTAITSPCDCEIVEQHGHNGEPVVQGETVFTLRPVEAGTWITASLPVEKAQHLSPGGEALIRIAGGNGFIKGHISDFKTGGASNSNTIVEITPENRLSPAAIGRQVYIRFASE